MSNNFKVNTTQNFAVFDLPSVQVNANIGKELEKGKKREQLRANKEHGSKMNSVGLIGGDFVVQPNPSFVQERSDLFDRLMATQVASYAAFPNHNINVKLPSGDVKVGLACKSTPYEIAKSISQGLADNIVIAKVTYTGTKYQNDTIVACDEDEEGQGEGVVKSGAGGNDNAATSAVAELWDLNRPLIGDCDITFLKYDDNESKVVFSHSSAHVLGGALEATFGAHLTIGPPLQQGFYYDSYMGANTIVDSDLKKLEAKALEMAKKKHPFERLVVTKEEVCLYGVLMLHSNGGCGYLYLL